jgi:hypothetical protein
MRIAMDAAKFSSREANGLRRAMATFRHMGEIGEYEEMMVGRLKARGYDPEFAERCFNQIKGFGEYGFPESHAASFALIAYASSWLKCHHPDVFCAALLNAQPMGFYAPAQIVRDAQQHQVEIRPVCINASRWDCTLEPAGSGARLAVRRWAGAQPTAISRGVSWSKQAGVASLYVACAVGSCWAGLLHWTDDPLYVAFDHCECRLARVILANTATSTTTAASACPASTYTQSQRDSSPQGAHRWHCCMDCLLPCYEHSTLACCHGSRISSSSEQWHVAARSSPLGCQHN